MGSKLAGKIIAVTGAASGIGRALGQELAARGCQVALSDVDAEGLKETVALIGDRTKVSSAVVDVRDAAAMEAWAADVVAAHGGVDGIINNAGLTAHGSVAEMPYEKFKRVIDVCMYGVLHGVRAFLPHLRVRGGGWIVNISSINAMVPFANNGPYNMAKYAVLGLSETLMQELANEQIHVTSVHPGGIQTNIVRNAEGYDQRQAALFERIARTSAQQAAKTILAGMEKRRRRVYIGADAKLMALAKRLFPGTTVRVAGRTSTALLAPRKSSRPPRKIWVDRTSELQAPLDVVEPLLCDVDGWSRWTPGLTAIRRRNQDPVQVGTRFKMVVKSKLGTVALPCQVTRMEPGLIEWGGGFAGGKIRHRFEYRATGAGTCRVRQVEYASGWLDIITRPVAHLAAAHDQAWSDALEAQFPLQQRPTASHASAPLETVR